MPEVMLYYPTSIRLKENLKDHAPLRYLPFYYHSSRYLPFYYHSTKVVEWLEVRRRYKLSYCCRFETVQQSI